MDSANRSVYFSFFNEIGIIEQLGRAMFEARLKGGVTLPHFSVLNHLVRVKDGRTPLELARAFQVPKTSMTNTLAGLELRGLVETRPNAADKRSKLVWLTPAGRSFRDDAIKLLDGEVGQLADQYPPEKIAVLVPALAEIRVILDTMREGK